MLPAWKCNELRKILHAKWVKDHLEIAMVHRASFGPCDLNDPLKIVADLEDKSRRELECLVGQIKDLLSTPTKSAWVQSCSINADLDAKRTTTPTPIEARNAGQISGCDGEF